MMIQNGILNRRLFKLLEDGFTSLEEIKELIENGADVNAVDDGFTPIMIAAKDGRLKITEYLAGQKADVNARVPESEHTALTLVAQNGRFFKTVASHIIEVLLKHGADVNAVNSSNISALMSAVDSNDIKSVKVLAKYNPDLTPRARNGLDIGKNAEEIARKNGYQDILEVILTLKNQQELDGMVKQIDPPLNTI